MFQLFAQAAGNDDDARRALKSLGAIFNAIAETARASTETSHDLEKGLGHNRQPVCDLELNLDDDASRRNSGSKPEGLQVKVYEDSGDLWKNFEEDELNILKRVGIIPCRRGSTITSFWQRSDPMSCRWDMPEELRCRLYRRLFMPTVHRNGDDASDDKIYANIFEDTVAGKIDILQRVQGHFNPSPDAPSSSPVQRNPTQSETDQISSPFISGTQPATHGAPTNGSEVPQKAVHFHDSVPNTLFLLKRQILTLAKPSPGISLDEFYKIPHSCDTLQKGLNHQTESTLNPALCDALMGWGPSKDIPNSQLGSMKSSGKLYHFFVSIVRLSNNVPRDKAPPMHRTHLLDASYIESHGPFRFIKTQNLNNHLTFNMESKNIMIYTKQRRFAILRNHYVLQDEESPATSIELVSQQINDMRHRVERVHDGYETVNSLLFFQERESRRQTIIRAILNYLATGAEFFDAVPRGFPAAYRRRRTLRRYVYTLVRILRSIGIIGWSSADIARRIGVNPHLCGVTTYPVDRPDPADKVRSLLNSDSQFRLNDPFKDRLDQLYEILENWKPANFWELRYAGYGAHDPVGTGAFYAAWGAAILTIIIVALAGAQTYAAFQTLALARGG